METLNDVLDTVSTRLTDSEYQEFLQRLVPAYKRVERFLAKQERKKLWASLPKREGKITEEMIERAKSHPIENLLNVQRGYCLCIFHDDKRPSMLVKNNFAHCFSCGKTADSIDVYRKLHGCSFPDAVRNLI